MIIMAIGAFVIMVVITWINFHLFIKEVATTAFRLVMDYLVYDVSLLLIMIIKFYLSFRSRLKHDYLVRNDAELFVIMAQMASVFDDL